MRAIDVSLVLTDMGTSVTCKVLSQVEDHNQVLTTVALGVPVEVKEARECWLYSKADWAGFRQELAGTNWDFLDNLDANAAQRSLTDHLLTTARKYVPVEKRLLTKSSHPWLNERCLELVQEKRNAEGTPEYGEKTWLCSEGLLEEFHRYVGRVCDD